MLAQTTATFSVGLCVKSAESGLCQITETHTVHVVGSTHLPGKPHLRWILGRDGMADCKDYFLILYFMMVVVDNGFNHTAVDCWKSWFTSPAPTCLHCLLLPALAQLVVWMQFPFFYCCGKIFSLGISKPLFVINTVIRCKYISTTFFTAITQQLSTPWSHLTCLF